jgi:hypothetical protein
VAEIQIIASAATDKFQTGPYDEQRETDRGEQRMRSVAVYDAEWHVDEAATQKEGGEACSGE